MQKKKKKKKKRDKRGISILKCCGQPMVWYWGGSSVAKGYTEKGIFLKKPILTIFTQIANKQKNKVFLVLT